MFNKVAKVIQWRKKIDLSANVAETMLIHREKNNLIPQPHTLHKTNQKWTIELNVKAKTIKILRRNIGEKFL